MRARPLKVVAIIGTLALLVAGATVAFVNRGDSTLEADPLVKTRTFLSDLTKQDFDACPIWEFCFFEEQGEGQNEETVRPRPDLSVVDPRMGLFVVKTTFTANDGSSYDGFCYTNRDFDLGLIQPVVLAKSSQVGFWHGVNVPSDEMVRDAYKQLGTSGTALFPLRFHTGFITNGVKEGTLSGFLFTSNGEVRTKR